MILLNLWRCLRRHGKRYNKRAGKNAGRGLIPNRIDISERPAIVVRKTRLGDWEGDTVVSAGRKGGLLTLVERKTKLTKIAKLPRATARATQKAAVRRLKPIAVDRSRMAMSAPSKPVKSRTVGDARFQCLYCVCL